MCIPGYNSGVPAGAGPVVHLMVSSITVLTLQSTPPTFTFTFLTLFPKNLPLIVMMVPPFWLPLVGATDSTSGKDTVVYKKVTKRFLMTLLLSNKHTPDTRTQ